jgi:hypothetical protein
MVDGSWRLYEREVQAVEPRQVAIAAHQVARGVWARMKNAAGGTPK